MARPVVPIYDTRWVNTIGDTMTGDLQITKSSPALSLNAPSNATSPYVRLNQTGTGFWDLQSTGSGHLGFRVDNAEWAMVANRSGSTVNFVDLYADGNIRLRVDGTTISALNSAVFFTATKGSLFGSAGGVATAVPSTDANILFYNFSSVNWAGMGTDGNGHLWFRTGISGTPDARVIIQNNGQVRVMTASVDTNSTLEVGGLNRSVGFAAGGNVSPAAGSNLEMIYAGGGIVQAYNRTAGSWQNLSLQGASIFLNPNGSNVVQISAGGMYVGGFTEVRGTIPYLQWYESDAATDEKFWRFVASAGDLYLQTADDAYSTTTDVMRFTRNGVTVTQATLGFPLLIWPAATGRKMTLGGTDFSIGMETNEMRFSVAQVTDRFSFYVGGYTNAEIASISTPLGVQGGGLDYLGKITLSGSASSFPNNSFHAGYDIYEVFAFIGSHSTTNSALLLRLRAGGADDAGATAYVYEGMVANQTPVSGPVGASTSFIMLAQGVASGTPSDEFARITIASPVSAGTRTAVHAKVTVLRSGVDWLWQDTSGHYATAKAHDSFTLIPGAGTFSGTAYLFGVRKT